MKDLSTEVQVENVDELIAQVLMQAVGPLANRLQTEAEVEAAVSTAFIAMLTGHQPHYVPECTVIPRNPSEN